MSKKRARDTNLEDWIHSHEIGADQDAMIKAHNQYCQGKEKTAMPTLRVFAAAVKKWKKSGKSTTHQHFSNR